MIYRCLSKFLNDNNLLFELQFGFRQNFSTAHVSINVTENMRQASDEGNAKYRIFVDLQDTFDTVGHEFLLSNLDHYGVSAATNNWFKSYFTDCK